MKKTSVFLVLSVVLGLTPLPAQESSVLERIDRQVSFEDSDFSAQYAITQRRPGQGSSTTTAAVFRRDARDTFTIIILEPEQDRGKGYLKIGNSLWLYDPVARRFTVTSARDRFENSNARNSDFTSSTLAQDYRIVDTYTEELGSYATNVYELEAVHDDVTFPLMKIWVDEDSLVRKYEDYSLSGQHLRTTAIPTYQRIGDRFVPVNIVIVDELRGATVNGSFQPERTVISVTRPSLRDIPDMVFTQAYLERVSQ